MIAWEAGKVCCKVSPQFLQEFLRSTSQLSRSSMEFLSFMFLATKRMKLPLVPPLKYHYKSVNDVMAKKVEGWYEEKLTNTNSAPL